jgi:nitrate/nitrite transporter NarK
MVRAATEDEAQRAFSLVQIRTLGGFIGLANFLPACVHDPLKRTKLTKVTQVGAEQPTKVATLAGSAVRGDAGCVSNCSGGVNTLHAALIAVIVMLVVCGLSGRCRRPQRGRRSAKAVRWPRRRSACEA